MEENFRNDPFNVMVLCYAIVVSIPLEGSSIGAIPTDLYLANSHLKKAIEETSQKKKHSIKLPDLHRLHKIVNLAIEYEAVSIVNSVMYKDDFDRTALKCTLTFKSKSNLENFESELANFTQST